MSGYRVFTLAEFNAAYDKWSAECIVFDTEKARSLEPKKGSEHFDVTYQPLQFKDVEGKIHDYPKFAFKSFTCAKARAPHGTNLEQVKHVNITFRIMSFDDIAGGDYIPKKLLLSDKMKSDILSKYMGFHSKEIKFDNVKTWLKKNLDYRPSMKAILKKIDTEPSADKFRKWLDDYAVSMIESQKQEDADMKKWIEEYVEHTKEFVNTLDRMNKAFAKACERLIKMGKDGVLEFDVQKDGSDRDPKIGTISQSEMVEGKGKNKKVHKFDHALYRLKLGVERKTGRVGYTNYKSQEFYPTVFDIKKSTKKNGWAAVPARVFEKNRKGVLEGKTLTWQNVGKFITYKSLLDGVLSIKEATMSKSGGISSKFAISRINVLRHKPSSRRDVIDSKKLQSMRRDDCSSDEDDDDMGDDQTVEKEDGVEEAVYDMDVPDGGDASSDGEDPRSD